MSLHFAAANKAAEELNFHSTRVSGASKLRNRVAETMRFDGNYDLERALEYHMQSSLAKESLALIAGLSGLFLVLKHLRCPGVLVNWFRMRYCGKLRSANYRQNIAESFTGFYLIITVWSAFDEVFIFSVYSSHVFPMGSVN